MRKVIADVTAAWIERVGVLLDTESARRTRRLIDRTSPKRGYGFVELDTFVLRYRDHDRGGPKRGRRTFVFAADPPIVLEHYDALVEALSGLGRVLVLELPGFGFSYAQRGFDFSFAACVQGIAVVFDRLDVRDATLCFPCVSAYLAIALGHARPDLVRNLVLAQAPSFESGLAWKRSRDPKGVLARPLLGQLAMHALKGSRAPSWYALAEADPALRTEMLALSTRSLQQGARWSLASVFQHFLVAGAAPAVSDKPIVALWGVRDRSHAATDRESSRSLGRDVHLLEWPENSHFPELESPRRFAMLLAELG